MIKKDMIVETEVAQEAIAAAPNLEEVQRQVFEIIEELCLMPIQNKDQTLIGDLGLDSLRMVMLLVTLEDTFEIELDESDMNPFALITVCDVIGLVMKYASLIGEDVINA